MTDLHQHQEDKPAGSKSDPGQTSLIPGTQTSNAVKHFTGYVLPPPLFQSEPVKPLTCVPGNVLIALMIKQQIQYLSASEQGSTCQNRVQGASFLPAHDLVGEEDATHLWILILAFVQDGLESQTE